MRALTGMQLLSAAEFGEAMSPVTVAITGASRGLGRAMAQRFARQGANVALLARSASAPSHASLHGTLEDVAATVKHEGGSPLVLETDVSDLTSVQTSMRRIAETFGCIDVLVNNASALYIGRRPEKAQTPLRVNLQGTLNVIEAARPLLEAGEQRHILSISPPVNSFSLEWAARHPAYTASKYGMTMITLGYADEFRANTLWPRKLYRTAATERIERELGQPCYTQGLDPSIFADAVHTLVGRDASGRSLLDSDICTLPPGGVDDIFLPE